MRVAFLQEFACQYALRPFLALALLANLVLFTSAATAQSENILTTEQVDLRLDTLEQGGKGGDGEVIAAYGQARDLLSAAASFRRDADSYAEAITNAPRRELEIQARIDTFEQQVKPASLIDQLAADELEGQLAEQQSKLNKMSDKLQQFDRGLAAREVNAQAVSSRIAEIDARLDAVVYEPLFPDLTAEPSLAEAEQWRKAAEVIALEAERRALRARLSSQPARLSTMSMERAEAALLVDSLSQSIRALESRLREQALQVKNVESLGIDTDDPIYGIAIEVSAAEAALRDEQVTLNDDLARVNSLVDDVKRISHDVGDRFATARRLVDFGGGSDGLGTVLTLYWDELEGFSLPYSTGDVTRAAGDAVVSRIKHEEKLKTLRSTSGYIKRELGKAGIAADSLSAKSREALSSQVRSYRERLRTIISTQSEYIEALRVLGDDHVKMTQQTAEYSKYLQSLILWIPDRPPLWKSSTVSINDELTVLKSSVLRTTLTIRPALFFGLIAFVLLGFYRARLRNYQLHLNELISRPRSDSTRYTLQALGCTALRALPLPLLLASSATLFSDAAAAAILTEAAIVLFALESVRLVCATNGVGPVHFAWPAATAARIHREVGWLIHILLPLSIVAFFVLGETLGSGDSVLGRLAIILVLALPLLYITSYLATHLRQYGRSCLAMRTLQARLALGAVLLMLIAAVALGHSYSTRVIFSSLVNTFIIGLGLILLHGVLLRWIRVTRRKIRLAALLESRQGDDQAEEALVEDPEVNLGSVSATTRELINVGTAVSAVGALFYIWAPLLPALEALEKVTLWTSATTIDGTLSETSFTLANLVTVIALIALTVFAARKLPALIELLLRSHTAVSPSSRYTVIALLNYIIVGAGITVTLAALGMQWSQLQWLVAALGVGIGFGLQEIIANFISGLIILFERPIRVGDIISTGGNDGVVTRIRIRATSIRDWDGKELLVPNKDFITGRLLNWTLSDVKVRLVIPVGVAYGSDVGLAIRTLESAVSKHPRVTNDPPLQIVFEGFGSDALSLSARFYLDSVDNRMGAVTEINQAIYREFNEAGIEIAFPQRDVHFDADKPIRIALEHGAD